MRSITAVEIGADTCALACTSVRRAEVRLAAAATLDPAAFPGIDAFTGALRQTRRSLRLPRRCRAVIWGLPDGASRSDPIVVPLIEPLTRAGFKVTRVVTPCNALGALARLRTSRSGGAMGWLGINRNGVAIVVIRPGKLLYSHAFAWDSSVGARGSQARLLQRYSLVAFLAPEVRRAIAAAREKGTTIDGLVTCGNLPDLRALTMPLIEELDIEVETLDSLEGLVMRPELAEKLEPFAPAIRLACAGAFARETRLVDERIRRRVRRKWWLAFALGAAGLALFAAAGSWWYAHARPETKAAPTSPGQAARPTAVITRPPASPQPSPPTVSAASSPSPAARASHPVPLSPPPTVAVKSPAVPPSGTAPVPSTPPATPPSAPPLPVTAFSRAPLHDAPRPADKPDAATVGREGAIVVPERLKDPVPRVTAILVSADRRLATIGEEGRIIHVGDRIGRREVVGIDDRTVLLREPSGLEIRVALGGRVVGVERSGR
jgi:hypothetical protein